MHSCNYFACCKVRIVLLKCFCLNNSNSQVLPSCWSNAGNLRIFKWIQNLNYLHRRCFQASICTSSTPPFQRLQKLHKDKLVLVLSQEGKYCGFSVIFTILIWSSLYLNVQRIKKLTFLPEILIVKSFINFSSFAGENLIFLLLLKNIIFMQANIFKYIPLVKNCILF